LSRSLPTVLFPEREELPGLPVLSRPGDVRRAVRRHRAAMAVVALLLVAGLSGWLGVRSTTSRAVDAGVELEVLHAAVSRPGLATPFEVRVRRDGGFDGPVRVAVPADYLALLDVSAVQPTPTSETTRDGQVVWELDRPEGEVLQVAVDGRVEPSRSRGASGQVAVLDGAGEVVVETEIRTVVLP
jgi:hypothetical protein